MTTPINERRRGRRSTVVCRLDAWSGCEQFLGCILDLSTDGARVLLLEDPQIETVRSLRLDLPRWLGLGPVLTLKGRFVWSRCQRGTGQTEAGFSFESVPAAQRRHLAALVERLCAASGVS